MFRFLFVALAIWRIGTDSALGGESASRFVGFTNLSSFVRTHGKAGDLVLISPRVHPKIDWDELIASWNVAMPSDVGLKTEVRVFQKGHATKFYNLGLWSGNPALFPRESVRAQEDGDGVVRTDTLGLNKTGGGDIELRITMTGRDSRPSRIKFLGVCFSNRWRESAPEKNGLAMGPLAVPEYSQMPYPGGEQWCSPTSTSMVLAYWGNKLIRPELVRSVPEVADGVFDKNWPGTGNWPFNTAYAGSYAGMRAFVSRFDDVSEIEEWIKKGLPVVASVSYATLKGKPGNDGHLVVCVGFTAEGNPIINDPGTSQNVRKVFTRENFVRAWATSRNTVYLIYPENIALPRDPRHHWSMMR